MKNFSNHPGLSALILVLFSTAAVGQEGIGLNPPSLKWSQISTPAGKVIFPKGLDTIAFYAASLMNYQRRHDTSISGQAETKRVPVILQNQSTLPAGFSTPAPWRNEYYLTPPQNMFLGPVRWELAMPVHEYRHAQQFSMANRGFTWVYKTLMGETGWLFNALMTQPLWFREGDAVVGETIYTKGGRGRLPSFHMEYRAMRLAGYDYSYEKAHYLSFRDLVPNPYRIGYYMVTKARRDFRADVWTRTLEHTYNKKGIIYPFSRSFRDITGMTTKQLYEATVSELDLLWKQTDASIQPTPSRALSKSETSKYTSFRYPHCLNDGSVFAMKSGLDLINTFYVIRSDEEKKLFSPGVYTEDHMTAVVEGDLLVWAESGFHERWTNKDYSIIKTCNLRTGKVSKLTSKTRYFSPAPSPDGRKIIVSETNPNIHYALVLLDAATGDEIRRLPNLQNSFFSHMRWQDNRYVIAVTVNDKGNTLVRIDTESGAVDMLMEETTTPLSRPYPFGDHVFFSAGNHGINNIFALNTANNKLAQVTRVRFGAFEPVVASDGKSMLYSEYTPDGYRIKEITLDPDQWQPAQLGQHGDIQFHAPLSDQEGTDLGELPLTHYPVRKYHALTSGLLNFYGWIPLPNIPEYGLELYTRNLMSTLVGTFGYAYNTNEDRSRYYARLTYAALYPQIELDFSKGMRRSANILPGASTEAFFEQEWRETAVSAGLRFPWQLTQGTHHTRLSLGGFYEYHEVTALDSADLTIETGRSNFHCLRGELAFTRLQTQARQHVKPRWGQQLSLDYRRAFDESPERAVATATLYFPGLFRTHSLNFRAAYKIEAVVDTYRYLDDFVMPRGYKSMPFRHLSVVSANYELPLWYPDLSAGSVMFIQRVRANIFLDVAEGKSNDFVQPMTSTGSELFVDLRLFRLFQATLAFRFNAPFESHAAGTTPFQFLITRFELAN